MEVAGVGSQTISAVSTSVTSQVVDEAEKKEKKPKKAATIDPNSVAGESINPPPQAQSAVEAAEAEMAGDVNAYLKSLEESLSKIEKDARDAGAKIKAVAHSLKDLLSKVPDDVKVLIKAGHLNEELHTAFNDNKHIAQLAAKEDKSIKELLG
jgi:hypothetical protein